eukprot:TRINITY_DN8854_c0_g1_i5.p1 TRINITY_DN8854_c0_g1~~TRINITY_DN8854_c0_g1_i5.p1  ORF type:complete len:376 (-),score=60.03 TRINITY_DN8854_c0_g1_i5:41-1168(-)
MKCDGQARDILLHSFDVLLSDLRRCPVDSLVRITNLGCNHVFIVSRGSTFTTPESYKYIERLAKVMPVDLEPTEEKKTFQTTTPFELLDSVLRVLTLGQIQRELSVTNSQESEELSSQVLKFSATHEKMLSVQSKRRRLAELNHIIEFEEKCVREKELHIREVRKDLMLQSRRLCEILDAVRQWAAQQALDDETIAKKSMAVGDIEKRIELRRTKMVSQLLNVYPVEIDETAKSRRVAIRGVSVANVENEEAISAALGYVTHIVILLSKYLNINLRYKPGFQASRSFIDDEVSLAQQRYPLFLRGGEKEKLGSLRLYCDLRQIMSVRNVSMAGNRREQKDVDLESPISYEDILTCVQLFFEKETNHGTIQGSMPF